MAKPANPRDDVLAFFKALEQQMEPKREVELYIGGGAAILLAYEGTLATVDVDFIGPKSGFLLEMSEVLGRGSESQGRGSRIPRSEALRIRVDCLL